MTHSERLFEAAKAAKEIDFQRFDYGFTVNSGHKSFRVFEFLPSITLTIDRQGMETFEFEERIFPGRIEYQLTFSWLIFCAYITIAIKTNEEKKP